MAGIRSTRWILFAVISLVFAIVLFEYQSCLLLESILPAASTSTSADIRGSPQPSYQSIWSSTISSASSSHHWVKQSEMLLQSVLIASFSLFSAAQSTVKLSYGQYQGTNLPDGVTEFLGIRYADKPQRFSASGPPLQFTGIRKANSYGPGCQGSGSLSSGNSEDCLFADIYVPTKALQSDSIAKLPVYVFIQGGGLTNVLGRFNGSGLVQAEDLNIITVTFTYRAGPFGFLASKEIQAGGVLNAGLLDQYQLLKWIQKEIVHFGGDHTRVTLGGQSAGAGCILSHLTAKGGLDEHLYQAALIQSPSSPPVRTVNEQQFQYDNLVKKAGCSGDTLACLRGLTTQQILAASDTSPYPGTQGNPVFGWHIVIDGTYVQDQPHPSFADGKFVRVPTMIGSVSDEGTAFTSKSISNSDQAKPFLQNNFPNLTRSELNTYSSLYGFESISPNYWLKAAKAYGETRYTCPAAFVSSTIPAWNFRYNIATSSQVASLQGAAHGSDLSAVWAPKYGSQEQINLLQGQAKQSLHWLQGYWISFIQTNDPNTKRFAGSPKWNEWGTSSSRFVFNIAGSRIEQVDKSEIKRCSFVNSISASLEQ